MLVYGLISPHPPIIVPEIGGSELAKVTATTTALETAVKALADTWPDELIVISPHEDHGFAVPEYYLRQQLPGDIAVRELLVTEPSYQYYYDYGQQIGEEARRSSRRVAIVASGDLSHVLKTDGPYGFDPAGPRLDEAIMAAVRERDALALLAIDTNVLEQGAECGLRSILFLLGAFEGQTAEMVVRSYEGPFGVGYMVATLAPDDAGARLIELARQSLQYYLTHHRRSAKPRHLPPLLKRRAGVFVSLHGADGTLRGCIGTITPTKASLAEEVMANAVAAATEDPRFEPVTAEELPALSISVDVLGAPVPESELARLDPQRYGVIVTARDGRRGVLLPDLEGVMSAEQQIAICREKGGIGPEEPVTIQKFEVERYPATGESGGIRAAG